ncbi:hypothetical protein POVWA1_006360 [Plasmodium ovale wallikeri]|uniref:Uncharacterized protein n=1 Tax=Plasmodium ovale wallikeri TaxID=864142 RepID=A0A1A8YIX4_PLAOA|nr:hypothetical protein POVWA1_006360 [Plasmodium ovale wallikeri]
MERKVAVFLSAANEMRSATLEGSNEHFPRLTRHMHIYIYTHMRTITQVKTLNVSRNCSGGIIFHSVHEKGRSLFATVWANKRLYDDPAVFRFHET